MSAQPAALLKSVYVGKEGTTIVAECLVIPLLHDNGVLGYE